MNGTAHLDPRPAIRTGWASRRLLLSATATGMAASALAITLADGALEGSDLSSYDAAVTASVVAQRTRPLTLTADVLSFVGSEVSVGFLTVVLLTWIVVRRRAWGTALVVGGSMALAGAATLLIKHLVLRSRPPAADVLGALDHGYAFPSGHTLFSTVFFGLVAGLVLLDARGGWVRTAALSGWVLMSAAVGLSRLYLGYHWLTDVVAGWSLGLTVLALAAAVTILTQPVRADRATSRDCAGGVPTGRAGHDEVRRLDRRDRPPRLARGDRSPWLSRPY